MSNMYEEIEHLCKEHDIKPGKLCAEIGISRGVLTDLKAGRTKELSIANATKIANYFGVSVEYLTGKKNKPATENDDELNGYLEELRNRSEMRMLFKLAKGATKEEVEQAVKVIEALRK